MTFPVEWDIFVKKRRRSPETIGACVFSVRELSAEDVFQNDGL